MRVSIFSSLALLAFPLIHAQNLGDLPECAQPAATSGIASTGCSIADFKCICSATAFITSLQTAVEAHCNQADQQQTLQFARQLCNSVGVTINPSMASTSSPAATSTSATSIAMNVAGDDAIMPSTSVIGTSMSSTSAMEAAPTPTFAYNGTSNGTAYNAPLPAAFQGSAVKNGGQAFAAVVIGVVGAVFVL